MKKETWLNGLPVQINQFYTNDNNRGWTKKNEDNGFRNTNINRKKIFCKAVNA